MKMKDDPRTQDFSHVLLFLTETKAEYVNTGTGW